MSDSPCYARHQGFKRSTDEWRANTSPLGVMVDDAGQPELELANCVHGCNSTLAREIEARP